MTLETRNDLPEKCPLCKTDITLSYTSWNPRKDLIAVCPNCKNLVNFTKNRAFDSVEDAWYYFQAPN